MGKKRASAKYNKKTGTWIVTMPEGQAFIKYSYKEAREILEARARVKGRRRVRKHRAKKKKRGKK